MVLLGPSPLAIKEIHATFIRQYGVEGYMCEGMVEGCLERAMTYIYKYQPFPKLFMKAGVILYSIIMFHPFVDGNKRTAFETTKIFLRLNGYEVIAPKDGVDFTKAIADGKITEVSEIARWLKNYSKRKLGYVLNSYLLKFVLLLYSKSSKEEIQTLPKQTLLLLQAIKLYPD
jgi:death-on-curing protein